MVSRCKSSYENESDRDFIVNDNILLCTTGSYSALLGNVENDLTACVCSAVVYESKRESEVSFSPRFEQNIAGVAASNRKIIYGVGNL